MASRARKHEAIAEPVAAVAPVAFTPPAPMRMKGISPPPRARTCQEFLDHWLPRIRSISDCVELDFSWRDDSITITDMRIPSALRTGVLYKRHEVEDNADREPGDLEKRVTAFLASIA